jgi:RHS repeat-associated protein
VVRSLDGGTAAKRVQDPDPWGGDPSKRWNRVLVDSFTRADANALGTAETGQSWTEVSNPTFSITDIFGIRSGKVHVLPQTVNYQFWALCPSNQSDVRVKVRLTLGTVIGTPPGTGVGILFRVNSTNSGILLHYLGGASNNWRWSNFNGGSTSNIATVTGPVLTQGVSYDLEVRASGSNCTAFVDGVQIGGTQTITDHQTDTYHGLYVFQSTDHLFENFSVLAEADAEAVGWLGDPGYVTEAGVMRRLEYVRARWYQAGGPGWLSKDPIGLRGGDVNLYRYVRNRPLVDVDADGLRPCTPPEVAYCKNMIATRAPQPQYAKYVDCEVRAPYGTLCRYCYKRCTEPGVCKRPECIAQTDPSINKWRFGDPDDALKALGLGRDCYLKEPPETISKNIPCRGHGQHWEVMCRGRKRASVFCCNRTCKDHDFGPPTFERRCDSGNIR